LRADEGVGAPLDLAGHVEIARAPRDREARRVGVTERDAPGGVSAPARRAASQARMRPTHGSVAPRGARASTTTPAVRGGALGPRLSSSGSTAITLSQSSSTPRASLASSSPSHARPERAAVSAIAPGIAGAHPHAETTGSKATARRQGLASSATGVASWRRGSRRAPKTDRRARKGR
jgi:hypothetical protein